MIIINRLHCVERRQVEFESPNHPLSTPTEVSWGQVGRGRAAVWTSVERHRDEASRIITRWNIQREAPLCCFPSTKVSLSCELLSSPLGLTQAWYQWTTCILLTGIFFFTGEITQNYPLTCQQDLKKQNPVGKRQLYANTGQAVALTVHAGLNKYYWVCHTQTEKAANGFWSHVMRFVETLQ